jgi:hypothetical protein
MLAALRRKRDTEKELCGRITDLEQRLEQLTNELAATTDADQLEQELSQARRQVEEFASQISTLTTERDAFSRECASLANLTAAGESELHLLRQQLQTATDNAAQLEQELSHTQRQGEELTAQAAVLRGERDDLSRKCDSLTSLQAAGEYECEALRQQLLSAAENDARNSEERALLTAECALLREELERLPHLHKQIRDAREERDNVSSELYRALLQLAELQENDDHKAALDAANRALSAELEQSAADIAKLQSQIDQLNDERNLVAETKNSLDHRIAQLIDSHQQLAHDKSTLTSEVADLRDQLEAARRHEAELSANSELSELWQQRLNELESSRAELSETVIKLEQELSANEQVRVEAAEALAICERQIADYSISLADANEKAQSLATQAEAASELDRQLQLLKQQYDEMRDNREHDRQQAASNELQLKEQVAKLEAQLTEIEAVAAAPELDRQLQLLKQQYDAVRDNWEHERQQVATNELQLKDQIAQLQAQLAEVEAAAAHTLCSAASALEHSAGSKTNPDSAHDFGAPNSSTEKGLGLATNGNEPSNQLAIDPLAAMPIETPETGYTWGQSLPSSEESPWSDSASSGGGSGQDWPTPTKSSREPQDRPEISGSQDIAPVSSPADEANDLASEWKSPAEAKAVSLIPESEQLPSPSQTPSFIERYSHMFADEPASQPQPPQPMAPPREDAPPKALTMGLVQPSISSPTSGDDQEESIEDYMVKLLQRVRGESAPAASVAALLNPKQTPPISMPSGFSQGPLSAPPSVAAGDLGSSNIYQRPKGKTPIPAPQTDLEALRALANESARRAISRHTARKHRRNATTKMIVSTLAGMTSLWLMLDAKQWWNLEFITACVSMIVAAYWAGEAFRTLLETVRAAAGDETDAEIEQLAAELRAPLPIDVEQRV